MKIAHYKTTRLFYIPVALLAFCGCDSFTESDMPPSELNTPAVFEEKSTAEAAISDIYAKIRDNGMLTGKSNATGKELGLYADELRWYGNTTGASDEYFGNALVASLPDIQAWWSNAYSQIYAVNAAMEGLSNSQKLLQEDKDRLTGEAKFLRALLHLYATELWGDIPYVTTTDYKINAAISKLPQAEVYDNIIADLKEAVTLLPADYLSGERVRANSFAAKALLARVYLYAGKNAEAIVEASDVIGQSDVYVLDADLGDTFQIGSSSAILQFGGRYGGNTYDGTTFIFNSGPPPAVALRQDFVDAFEPGDLRFTNWVRKITTAGTSWYHAYKYRKTVSSSPQLEYEVVLRLAEQYLIRAEARARQNDLEGAASDLNVIRQEAGLADTTAATKDDLLDAILNERRFELFTEFGHRFIDLRRSGKIDAVLGAVKPGWNATDRLLPLPEKEVLLNPHLSPHNNGY